MVQPLRTSTPTEALAGLVERVTFHNEENELFENLASCCECGANDGLTANMAA